MGASTLYHRSAVALTTALFDFLGNSDHWYAFSLIEMANRFEDQPWYSEWKKVIDRVVTARMALDSTKPDIPEREAASREYDAALEVYRSTAQRLWKV
jgi:hypothetical protein